MGLGRFRGGKHSFCLQVEDLLSDNHRYKVVLLFDEVAHQARQPTSNTCDQVDSCFIRFVEPQPKVKGAKLHE